MLRADGDRTLPRTGHPGNVLPGATVSHPRPAQLDEPRGAWSAALDRQDSARGCLRARQAPGWSGAAEPRRGLRQCSETLAAAGAAPALASTAASSALKPSLRTRTLYLPESTDLNR